ncbi:MAG: 15-cis-phytoene synthase [Patescibacteria group bacterium]|jgi:phytoene synthase|nr:15-cis-phytoene synthase [Patescibacteria group bacterium]
MTTEKDIFKRGSTTYYFSSIFFPPKVRDDVFKLYSFVRVADDYVDNVPTNTKQFTSLRKLWESSITDKDFQTEVQASDDINLRVVRNMVFVSRKYSFEHKWVTSFLDSMQADIDQKKYRTIADTFWYMYGSAEVIGLMMAKIMGLPEVSYKYAQMQGRAMQYINFVRDIAEDNTLGRQYFPVNELKKFGLQDLQQKTVQAHPESFENFLRAQINLYRTWQTEADKGFDFIPKRLRIPLQTATDMYNWTAQNIYKAPNLVFVKKLKPSKYRVIGTVIKNTAR